jgi:hypothetical protein
MERRVKQLLDDLVRDASASAMQDEDSAPDDVERMLGMLSAVMSHIRTGDVRALVLLTVDADGGVRDAYTFGGACNRFAVLGGLEVLKRDMMRTEIESRVEYVQADFDSDEDDE